MCIYPCREVLLAGEPYDNLATPYNMLRGLKAIGVTDNLDVVRLRVMYACMFERSCCIRVSSCIVEKSPGIRSDG